MIFPFLEQAERSIQEETAAKPTAAGFINMLYRMRRIILQDAAEMMLRGRNHTFFSLPVFNTPIYASFMIEVQAAISAESPLERTIDLAIPEVAQRLQSLQNMFSQELRKIQNGQSDIKSQL